MTELPPRVVLRPLASPLPLGFLAVAVGSFTLAGLELSWVSAAEQHVVGLAVLAFVVPIQLVSTGYGFLARDSAASVGMGVQAGAWFAIGTAVATGPAGRPSGGLGLVLLGAGAALLMPAVTAASTKVLACLVMVLTCVRFWLTAGYELSGSPGWHTAAGVCGLVLAVAALYAGLAFDLEDNQGRTVLPILRRGVTRQTLSPAGADGTREVAAEAGVRRTL